MNKNAKIQSHQLALHSLRGFWGWNGELSSEQLDEHRGRGEEEEGWWKFKKVQEDRGWLLTVNTPRSGRRREGGRRCMCRGLDVKRQQKKSKIKTSVEKWSFWIVPIEKSRMERRSYREKRDREKEVGGGGWGEWEVPPAHNQWRPTGCRNDKAAGTSWCCLEAGGQVEPAEGGLIPSEGGGEEEEEVVGISWGVMSDIMLWGRSMLASWVLPGWMSDTQEQLKETLEWLLLLLLLFVVVVVIFLSVLFWHSREETRGRRRRKVQKGGHGGVCVGGVNRLHTEMAFSSNWPG